MRLTASKPPRLAVPGLGLVLETELGLELEQVPVLALVPVLEQVPVLVLVLHIRQPTGRPTRYQR